MKIISISRKKFEELENLKLDKEVFKSEADVYDFEYKGESKILKSLYTLNGYTFANKLYTLEMLDSNKRYLPSSFYIPDNLCTMEGKIIGFTVPKIDGINLSTILSSKNINYKEQIYYLKKIGEILNQLHNIRRNTPLKDIYINDLHDSNFVVDYNNKELKVIDLDSCKIGSNKPFAARYLTPVSLISGIEKYKKNKDNYSNGYIIADSNSELYCYCIIILNYLYGNKCNQLNLKELDKYLNYLLSIGIDKNLINVFYKLFYNESNENPLNYLDSLTEDQINKAKESEYIKIKK